MPLAGYYIVKVLQSAGRTHTAPLFHARYRHRIRKNGKTVIDTVWHRVKNLIHQPAWQTRFAG